MSTTDSPNTKKLSAPALWLAGALLVAAGLVATAYSLGWFRSKPSAYVPPEVGSARVREAIPVPEVLFTDVTEAAGIRFTHVNGAAGQKLLPETMGSGVAVLDF